MAQQSQTGKESASWDFSAMGGDLLTNAFTPVNPTNTTLIMGEAQVIAAEVALSMVIRWFLKAPKRTIMDLVAVHGVSQAFLGGFGGYFEKNKPLGKNTSTTQALQDGAKAIPGLLYGRYVVNTAYVGLHMPTWSMQEFLILAASKALTRPLINIAYDQLPNTVQANFVEHDVMVENQVVVSRFKSKPKAESA